MGGKNKNNAQAIQGDLPQEGGDVNSPQLPCKKKKPPQLLVKVYCQQGSKKTYVGANVKANELSKTSQSKKGIADFATVKAKEYTITVESLTDPDDKEFFIPKDLSQKVTLQEGEKKTVELQVQRKNIVTPKLEVEYKVVLFDRNLAQHLTGGGDPLKPEPTYIQASLECTNNGLPYTGEGTLDAPGCEVFLDEACTQKLTRKLTNAELTASPAKKLYLRGTARGLFTLTLTLDPSTTPGIEVKPPATEDMGVVGLDLDIHQHDTPVAVNANTYPLTGYCTDLEKKDLIPPQVVMSDADKVGKGRLLHVQEKGNHGRAKAVLKLTAGEWPGGTDGYLVVLESTPSSDLSAFDAETDGKKQSLPLKSKVSDLKAKAKELWIEGAKISGEIRGARLSLALDRPSGGLAKTPKANADWALFTVVKIDSVELVYTEPAAGNPKPWNASKHRWYINYQNGDAGRTVKMRAKLSKPIAGIKIHFMLSPDKDNMKEKNWGIDKPGTWDWNGIASDVKQKDKTNTTDLLHLSKDTDAAGKAECDLVLSRFGGDKFWPAAYISQDPHLAAYVHGHDKLEKRKPKHAEHEITVWRKFAYQKVKVEGRNYPSTDKAEQVYDRVRAEMHKIASVHKTASEVQRMALPSLLPEYMFKVNGSKKLALNVSDANQSQFFNLVAADGEHPIKVPIITCDFNWGEERDSGVVVGLDDLQKSAFPMNVGTDVHVCDPPLQGGNLLVSGDWEARDWDQSANGGAGDWVNQRNGTLAAGDVDIDPKRDSINKVRIKLPAINPPATNDTRITISNLVVQGAPSDFLGGYNCDAAKSQAIVCVFDPANAFDYQNTIVHELGHAFYQTLGVAPAAGIPANPNYILDPTGPHCTYNANKCVMFTSGPIPGSLNRYCPDCHPHMLVQNMADIKP